MAEGQVLPMNLQEQVNRLGARLTELERKARGTSLANKRVAGLETEVERLKSRVELFGTEPEKQNALAKEFERLEKKFNKAWTDMEGELSTIRSRVDEHDETIRIHGEGIAELRDVVGNIPEAKYDLEKTRVEVLLDRLEIHAPWGLALLAGVVAFIATWWGIYGSVHSKSWHHTNDVFIGVIVGVAMLLLVASFEDFSAKVSAKLVWALRKEPKKQDEPKQAPVEKTKDDKTAAIPVVVRDKKEVNA